MPDPLTGYLATLRNIQRAPATLWDNFEIPLHGSLSLLSLLYLYAKMFLRTCSCHFLIVPISERRGEFPVYHCIRHQTTKQTSDSYIKGTNECYVENGVFGTVLINAFEVAASRVVIRYLIEKIRWLVIWNLLRRGFQDG